MINEDGGVKIEGLDLIDVINFVHKRNKKYQAILLSDIEDIMGRDSEDFQLIRKLVLDSYNDFTRSLIRLLFGNVEDITYTDAGTIRPDR